MLKKLLFLFGALWALPFQAQECADLISPASGATNVPVETAISWESTPGIPNYKLRLGTSELDDDLGEVQLGSSTFYQPPRGLPENTEIFVTVVLDFPFTIEDDVICSLGSFTTEVISSPPECAALSFPQDGATNVSVFTNIRWPYAPRALAYRVVLTNLSDGSIIEDVVINGNLSFLPTANLPPNTLIGVQITAQNGIGPSLSDVFPTPLRPGNWWLFPIAVEW